MNDNKLESFNEWIIKCTSLTHEEYHILRAILCKIRNEVLFDNKWNSIDVIKIRNKK